MQHCFSVWPKISEWQEPGRQKNISKQTKALSKQEISGQPELYLC